MINNFNIYNKLYNLFFLSFKIGKGLIIWLNNGLYIKNIIIKILLNLYNKSNYFLVESPHIGLNNMYIISGHYLKYKKNFFNFYKKSNYYLKPMNCPHHCYIYKYLKPKLPFRIIEYSYIYRYEKSGELKNIFRSRSFIQDDCHIFCKKKHINHEINIIFKHILYIFKIFNFNKFKVILSIKNDSDKYINNKYWNYSQNILLNFLINKKIKFNIIKGEAAFYGPKIDFMVKDLLGKYWQLSTIQLDYNLPINFNLNHKKKIIIIHRALLGSFERFIGLILENNNNNLPIWLSIIHLSIIPINIKFLKFSQKIKNYFFKKINIIIKLYNNFKKNLNFYIKKSELKKIPFILVIGEKEYKKKKFILRCRNKKYKFFKNIKLLLLYIKYKINIPLYDRKN